MRPFPNFGRCVRPWCHFDKVIADQSTYRGKFIHTFASGQGERFGYLLAPVLDENRNTEAIVCISRDISEQELAEAKYGTTPTMTF